jgi:hypothetical protein
MLLKTIDHEKLFRTTTVAHGYPETVLGPCTSTTALGNYPANTKFTLVILHATTLTMLLETSEGTERAAVATTPLRETTLTLQDLADEVFYLLMRGHSMHTPSCTCATPMTPSRLRQLGLAARCMRRTPCPLEHERQRISTDVVARELGVAQGQAAALTAALLTTGQFGRNDDDAWSLKPVMCQSEAHLWQFLRKHPLGVFENNPLIQSADLARHVASLAKQKKLVVRQDCAVRRLFACTAPCLAVDKDVRALWFDA